MERGRFFRWVGIAALLLVGCNTGSHGGASTSVLYAVVGTACSASITYKDITGAQTFATFQPLPWQFSFAVPPSQVDGLPLYLSATNNCASGTVTANVVVNGTLFSSNTSTVPNGTAIVQVSLF